MNIIAVEGKEVAFNCYFKWTKKDRKAAANGRAVFHDVIRTTGHRALIQHHDGSVELKPLKRTLEICNSGVEHSVYYIDELQDVVDVALVQVHAGEILDIDTLKAKYYNATQMCRRECLTNVLRDNFMVYIEAMRMRTLLTSDNRDNGRWQPVLHLLFNREIGQVVITNDPRSDYWRLYHKRGTWWMTELILSPTIGCREIVKVTPDLIANIPPSTYFKDVCIHPGNAIYRKKSDDILMR